MQTKEKISFIFLFFSTISSYFLGLAYYDSTRGLDFNRYIKNVKFLQGENVEIYDGQGTIYYYILSKFLDSLGDYGNYIGNISVNNSIQFFNFILFIIGLLGLYFLMIENIKDKSSVLVALSILCFFPPAFYFRLTMKPEAMAFAIMPWCIYLSYRYISEKKLHITIFLSLLMAILLSLKGSITGMVILCFLNLFWNEIKKIREHIKLIITTLLLSIFSVLLNFQITSWWLFRPPVSLSIELEDKWNNVAPLDFFVNLDINNLLFNPYKHLHADSFISITLIDTLSDYFTFFWNHRETSNYIAYNRIEFSDNFLIQAFLPQYISILFTIIFYIFVFVLLFKKTEVSKIIIFPCFGIFILILNALGIPGKNFDPTTGDLFKVHYYSFLLAISFFALTVYLLNNIKKINLSIVLLIPIFLLSMGFPKSFDSDINLNLIDKLSYSELCFLIELNPNIECNNL